MRFALSLPLFDELADPRVVAGLGGPPGTDPAPYAEAGATWWMAGFWPYGLTVDAVRGVLRDGAPA